MGHQGVAAVQRQPQVLAPAAGRDQRAAAQRGGEVDRPGGVSPYRAGVEDLDGTDGVPHDMALEAGTDDLDLGQLGH
jgi:hypothetical protein